MLYSVTTKSVTEKSGMAGRRPIGQRAMTPAERQRRRRARMKAAQPRPGSDAAFRIALLQWLQERRALHPGLSAGQIHSALKGLANELGSEEWCRANNRPHSWSYYLHGSEYAPVEGWEDLHPDWFAKKAGPAEGPPGGEGPTEGDPADLLATLRRALLDEA
jgi:hypothetical protein